MSSSMSKLFVYPHALSPTTSRFNCLDESRTNLDVEHRNFVKNKSDLRQLIFGESNAGFIRFRIQFPNFRQDPIGRQLCREADVLLAAAFLWTLMRILGT